MKAGYLLDLTISDSNKLIGYGKKVIHVEKITDHLFLI